MHIWVLALADNENEVREDYKTLNEMVKKECPKDLAYGEGKSRWIHNRVADLVRAAGNKASSKYDNDDEENHEDDGKQYFYQEFSYKYVQSLFCRRNPDCRP
jgi:hypothetical protein